MTEYVHALRTTAGWSGMTAGEQAAYAGYFTTFTAWLDAVITNGLATDIWTLETYAEDWPSKYTLPTSLTGVTSGIILRIVPASGQNALQIEADSGANATATFSVSHTTDEWVISGLDVYNTRTSGPGIFFNNPGYLIGCTGKTNATQYAGIAADSTTSFQIADWPTLIFCHGKDSYIGFGKGFGLDIRTRYKLYNCLATGNTYGAHSGATNSALAKNTICYNNTTDWNGTWDASSDYNASSDATGSPAPGANSYGSDVVAGDFVDAASSDYHLDVSSALLAFGSNEYSVLSPSGITTDPDGDAMPETGNWDLWIGRDISATGVPTLKNLTVTDQSATDVDFTVFVDY